MSDAALYEAGEIVMTRVGIPKDHWEIAAQLEVLGYRDIDARDRFGSRDLFEAAAKIFELFRNGSLKFVVDAENEEERSGRVTAFFRHYLDGLMFSLPMVVQGATMLLFGYGLWGAINLDARTGSAIGLAFIASYIATSGFSWAIVSRGLYYHYQSEGGLARWSAMRLWWISLRVALGLAVPAMLFNFLYRLLPLDMAFTALAYYVALVFLWLNWSLIYLVRRTMWLVAVLIVSILIVVGLARYAGFTVVAANLAGLAIADVLTFFVATIGLRQWARNGAGKPTNNPPRLTVLIYATAQVFLYGFLYSAFIFTDRILAWTGSRGREDFPPYPFWLNSRYELGMDLALIVIVLLAGIVEHSAQRFSYRLIPSQKKIKSSTLDPFIKEFRAFYRRHTVIFIVSAIVSIAVAALAFNAMETYADPRLQQTLRTTTTITVFWLASISYAIFMYALQNILMLMILSRADIAARAMAIALAFNVVAGFAFSRAIHFSGAIGGLLVGSIVLAVLTLQQLRAVLRELDYNYYAAF